MIYNGIVVITNPSARERFFAGENHETPSQTEFLISSPGVRTRVLLTAAERVLLHLLPLWNAKDAVHPATQEGISEGTGLRRSHVPRALKRLSVQFRGMGFPEQELVVSGTVREAENGRVVVDTVAAQGGNQVIRNAEAELQAP